MGPHHREMEFTRAGYVFGDQDSGDWDGDLLVTNPDISFTQDAYIPITARSHNLNGSACIFSEIDLDACIRANPEGCPI